jgi:hypothetical protein
VALKVERIVYGGVHADEVGLLGIALHVLLKHMRSDTARMGDVDQHERTQSCD